MIYAFIFLGVPFILSVLLFIFLQGVTIKEFLLYTIAHVVVLGLILCAFIFGNSTFEEVWNGQITSKYAMEESCEHSYKCHCYYTTDSKGNMTEHCSTCYEHSYDVSWYAKDSCGNKFNINRVDRQGLNTPSRWSAIKIGEPTATTHSYKNYIKNSDNILKDYVEVDYPEELPEYPIDVFDYYKLNRFISIGYNYTQSDVNTLSEINGELGPVKECNIIVVVTKNKPQDIANALMSKWRGANKNDIVCILNVDESNKVTWVTSYAMTKTKTFQVKFRDAVMEMGVFDSSKFFTILKENVKLYYDREEMKNYEYLEYTSTLKTWQIVLGLMLGFSFSIGSLIFLHNNEVI